jgi:rubrerythrin
MYERVKQPKENWVIRHNTHEQIVTQAEFDAVLELTRQGTERRQNILANRKGAPLPDNIFKGLLFCGVCGYSLNRTTDRNKENEDGDRRISYVCLTCQKRGNRRPKYIPIESLKTVILGAIKAQLKVCVEVHALADKFIKSDIAVRRIAENEKEIAETRRRIAFIEGNRERLLCADYDGLLSKSDYQMVSERRETELTELQARLDSLLAEQELYKPGRWDRMRYVSDIKRFIDSAELTRELLEALVERIEVTDEQSLSVSIKMKFQDEFAEVCGFVNAIGGDAA